MTQHDSLVSARRRKNDEFFTRLPDIEDEMRDYENWLAGKSVYLNCDDTRSAFYRFFHDNFERIGLRSLTATHIENGASVSVSYDGKVETFSRLHGNGDFRSDECQELVDVSDVVISNPPFSMFIEYVTMLLKHDVDFVIIGNSNAIFCKEIFPEVRSGKIHTDQRKPKIFDVNDAYDAKNVSILPDGNRIAKFGNTCWYSTVPNTPNDYLRTSEKYDKSRYPRYDNYDAIEVSKVKDIPSDYDGIMGVPISFIDRYNPRQFEIVWQASGNTKRNCPQDIIDETGYRPSKDDRGGAALLDGKSVYSRLLVRHIRTQKTDERVDTVTSDAYGFLMERLKTQAGMRQDGGNPCLLW